MRLSIVLPAKNEATGLRQVLPLLRKKMPDAEIIVVDDGSTDETGIICSENQVQHLKSPYSMGNGAAIKRGALAAKGETLVFMDADGQHNPEDIPAMLQKLDEGYLMTVGARDGSGQANAGRGLANALYNRLASWMTGHRIDDLTSGFRAVRTNQFREFIHLLPNGFSYPTTITMAFFRSAYPVAYVPVDVKKRIGTTSHIRPIKDGVRFLLIIFKIATLYSPLKLFIPTSGFFMIAGVAWYLYSYLAVGRFTNMSALLFSVSILVFLMGLISEQITALMYRPTNKEF